MKSNQIQLIYKWTSTLYPNGAANGNLIYLNSDKCSLIWLSSKQDSSNPSYSINNHIIIANSEEVWNSGKIVSKSLSFDSHYKHICCEAYQTLFLICRILPLKHHAINIKKQIYPTLIQSKFSSCSQLWRPHLIKCIIMIENVQQRASKFITNDCTSDYKSRLQTLELFPIMFWYKLQD